MAFLSFIQSVGNAVRLIKSDKCLKLSLNLKCFVLINQNFEFGFNLFHFNIPETCDVCLEADFLTEVPQFELYTLFFLCIYFIVLLIYFTLLLLFFLHF